MLMVLIGGKTTLISTLNKKTNLTVDKASGIYLYSGYDKYIDMCLGNGTHILGHHPLYITNGSLYAASHTDIDQFMNLLNYCTGFTRFAFCNSGSEATLRAARIARAYTGKNKIIMFNGGWHGTSNTFLDCDGIPEQVKELVIRLPYGEIPTEIDDVAMVIIEPVQGSLPKNNREFIFKLQEFCERNKIVFCLDEVVTGFRLSLGGAKQYMDLSCDLVCYGKLVGGGLPIGIVAGTEEIMDSINGRVTMGGTYSANPATVSAGIDTLGKLIALNPYSKLYDNGKRLREGVNIPGCQMVGTCSFSRLIFTDKEVNSRSERDLYEDQDKKSRFYDLLLDEGVYVGVNGLMFLSTEHTEEVIENVITAFNTAGSKL